VTTNTRERLLATALHLFSTRGYNGTGVKELTAASSATTGSLYHFFPGGKKELAAAAIRESGAYYETLYQEFRARHSDPGATVDAFFAAVADALEQGGYIDLCPIGTMAGEVASTHDDLREVADQVFRGWGGAVAAHLVDWQVESTEADELADTIVSTLLGGFVVVRSRRNGDPLRGAGRQLHTLLMTALPSANA
jgi:AcrR family transcriptional regulator